MADETPPKRLFTVWPRAGTVRINIHIMARAIAGSNQPPLRLSPSAHSIFLGGLPSSLNQSLPTDITRRVLEDNRHGVCQADPVLCVDRGGDSDASPIAHDVWDAGVPRA